MKPLSRHLPPITNRIEFRLDGLPVAKPLITSRIDFSDALPPFKQDILNGTESYISASSAVSSNLHWPLDSEDREGSLEAFQSDTADNDETLPVTFTRIPKPSGEPGRPHSGGYNLDEELGAWDPEMLSTVNTYVKAQAKDLLDLTKSYSKQRPNQIAQICSSAAKFYPIVEKYDNHWPVRDMLKLHLKYTSEAHRKQIGVQKVRNIPAGSTYEYYGRE